jgi:hypothetical protein
MANVILILLLGAGLAAGLVWLARLLRELRADWSSQLSERTAEVDRRLLGVTETMDRRLGELDTKVDRRLESASARRTWPGSSRRFGRRRPGAASASSCWKTCCATACRRRRTRCNTRSIRASAWTRC